LLVVLQDPETRERTRRRRENRPTRREQIDSTVHREKLCVRWQQRRRVNLWADRLEVTTESTAKRVASNISPSESPSCQTTDRGAIVHDLERFSEESFVFEPCTPVLRRQMKARSLGRQTLEESISLLHPKMEDHYFNPSVGDEE
jgi:hypothetical protein